MKILTTKTYNKQYITNNIWYNNVCKSFINQQSSTLCEDQLHALNNEETTKTISETAETSNKNIF